MVATRNDPADEAPFCDLGNGYGVFVNGATIALFKQNAVGNWDRARLGDMPVVLYWDDAAAAWLPLERIPS